MILPACRHPTYIPSITTKTNINKETVLDWAQKMHCSFCFKVYCDGFSFKGRIGAVAILCKNIRIVKTSRLYLGTPDKYTIYKAEQVGISISS